jgi:hypothetical protein
MASPEISRQPVAVRQFFDSVSEAAVQVGARKTVTAEAAKAVINDGSIRVPGVVQSLLGRYNEKDHGAILDSVLRGAQSYQHEHGFAPDASLIEHALNTADRQAMPLKELLGGSSAVRLDDATNLRHDQLSLQPAMAITAIMAQMAEAIPFAAYLPADIKTNEARLAILQNEANSNFGDYAPNASLDGIASGGAYLDSERIVALTPSGTDAITGNFTARTTGAIDAGNPAVPVLRGRTVLLVNGAVVGRDQAGYGSGNNPIVGAVTIGGTAYTLSGTVNSDTGAFSITPSAALPGGTKVHLMGYIDFEKAPQVTPQVGTRATIFSLYARPTRGIARSTIDAMTQMQGELSLDPRGQALLSIRSQHANELHYRALEKGKRLAEGVAALVDTWNYDYSTQIAEKDRWQIWLNLQPVLGALSQRMANITIDHGITTLYLTGELAAQVQGLPSTIWQSSGIADRPGIYRLGRLFGKYDVYYTPKVLTETNNGQTSQILCVGRASQVARNPYVMGDAVPPVFVPLATGTDMVQQDGYYCRRFAEVNPHTPSSLGFALVNVTNIK